MEAFVHAGVENNSRVNIKWVQSEEIKNQKSADFAFSNSSKFHKLSGF